MLAQAERFIESQRFHLMTKEDIPLFARCAAESYGSITYALDDYFVGHPCTKDELWEMWLFNLKYFHSKVGLYRHFGFEVVSDDPIPGTDVTHWGMIKQM